MRKLLFPILIIIFSLLILAGTDGKEKEKKIAASVKSEQIVPVVYFTRDLSPEGVMKLYEKIKEPVKGRVGYKIHFGQPGNPNIISPVFSKSLVKKLNATLVETNVLYPGPRRFTKSHLEVAKKHGFDFAPIDILDSEAEKMLPVSLKHFKQVRVGTHMDNYDSFVVFSHFKGHGSAGFGGAIKNVSMGFGSIGGKLAMHAKSIPTTDPSKCINCKVCLKECPADAIKLQPLVIDPEKCIGCGKCIGACPTRSFGMARENEADFHEKLAEYAKGIKDKYPMVFINVIAKISEDCDCFGAARKPFMKDVGIVASHDMVAIDTASLDLVDKAYGKNDTFKHVNNISGKHTLVYGEKIGLGSMKYQLVDIDAKPAALKK